MKEIKLTQGKVALVGDDDYEQIGRNNWSADWDGYNWYAVRNVGTGPFGKTFPMHRQIMNNPPGMEVDHIDGNGLNNQRSNLRVCTHADNIKNCKVYRTNKSGFRGVSKHRHGRWQSEIQADGKGIYIGLYDSPIDAARAYNQKAIELHGEFARLNTIPEGL